MGWEQRSGRRYYYQKRRKDGRVVSHYLGTGKLADLISLIDENEYLERRWNQVKWQMQKDEVDKLDKDQKKLSQLTRQVLRAYLLTQGYHPHKGQWRKKRHER